MALNRRVDPDGRTSSRRPSSKLVAAGVDPGAAETLARRQRMRVLRSGAAGGGPSTTSRSVDGGLLVQTPKDTADRQTTRAASRRPPTDAEWSDLHIAVRVCRHVKSNTVVIVRDGGAVGVGAGQMSRVEAAELAVARAGEAARGAVAASDAFFPFADGLEMVGRAGATAVIQPGGSRKDDEVAAAADALGMAMVMTGERHFRH